MSKKVASLILCVLLSVNLMFSSILMESAADEFDLLKDKWLEMLNGGSSFNVSDTDFAAKIKQIQSDANTKHSRLNLASDRTYIFNNYKDPSVSSNVTGTYQSLKSLALAVSTKGCSQYGNTVWKTEIIEALKWLITNNWYNSTKSEGKQGNGNNWWDWEIGIPLAAQDVLCLLYDDLAGTTVINDYCDAVDHFNPDPNKANFGQVASGANRAWVCGIVLRRGILAKDSTKIAAARDATTPLFTAVTKGDGFYEDGSFIQHSAHPYTQGYGNELLFEISKLTYLLAGSTWKIDNSKFSNLYKWVYDSFEPIIYDGRMFSTGYTSSGATGAGKTHTFIKSLIYLCQAVPDQDAAYFKSLIKHYVGALTVEPFLSDSATTLYDAVKAREIMNDSTIAGRGYIEKYKQFNSMDRAYLLRQTYGLGISMFSTRIENYESVGSPGNNRKGWHQGDGWVELADADKTQFTDNYWPTVDSYRLPGTTVEQKTTVPEDKLSSASWVGGTDLAGKYGITGMQLKTPGQTLSANKGWFMFDNEIVCLGSSIAASDDKIVETIVENRKLNSTGSNVFIVNGTAKPTNLDWSEKMNGVSWAHLTGNTKGSDIGYYFPEGATISGLREARTGTWEEINGGSTASYTRNYLTLWFDHGSNPTSGSYSYVMIPGVTASQALNYSTKPDISIVENSVDAMAVKENTLNMIGINFWKDAEKKVDMITSDRKAAVIAKDNEGQDYEISVCDTTQLNKGTINITINKSANSVISKDDAITVTQLSPSIKFSVNVINSRGKSFKIKFDTKPTSTPTSTSTPVTPQTYNISGYIKPDFIVKQPEADLIYQGTVVELEGTDFKALTDAKGYFEIKGVPSNDKSYTVKISKPYYLYREVRNVIVNSNKQLSSSDIPIAIWAGDVEINGVQDNIINMSDIIAIAGVFGSIPGDGKYNQNCDYNRDSAINISDVMIVAKHFNAIPSNYEV